MPPLNHSSTESKVSTIPDDGKDDVMSHREHVDIVVPSSSFRLAMPVSTFSGKEETEATIERLLAKAKGIS